MKAHVVENGVVTNTVEVDNLSDIPNLVAATSGGIGWLYDGSSFSDPNAPTQEELDARKSISMRNLRNALLAKTDYLALSDVTMSTEMITYRQALRDLPAHENWPNLEESDWPTKP